MKFTLDVYHHQDQEMHNRIDYLIHEVKRMSDEIDRLSAEVAKNTEVDQSAITLLNNLSDLIRDNVNDPTALAKLADDLQTSSDALAAAVIANTPAEGGDVPEEPEEPEPV